jgi:hypothetical protein
MTREQFLAALYTDDAFRERFFCDPGTTALAAGLSEDDADELARMDMEALRLAARSFEKKRAAKALTRPSATLSRSRGRGPLDVECPSPARQEKVPRSGG